MNKYVILILLLLTTWTGCDLTGGGDPPYAFSKDSIIYTNISELRQDSIIVRYTVIHYKGFLIKDTKSVQLDTTFYYTGLEDNMFTLSGIRRDSLWHALSILPDTIGSLENGYQTLYIHQNNGDVRSIIFSEKIPEIDSLVIQFEQLSYKLLH